MKKSNLLRTYLDAWKKGEMAPLFSYHLRHGLKAPLPDLLGPRDTIPTPAKEHQELQKQFSVTFSALMPVFKPKPHFLKRAIESVLAQSAPSFELLIGLDGPQPDEVIQTLQAFGDRIKLFSFEWGGISKTTNCLAERAKGDYLLLVDHDDWVAPDLLYWYHKKLKEDPQLFLYCDEFKIDVKDRIWPHTYFRKPLIPPFPFVFFNVVTHALLVPKTHWIGLRSEVDGAQDFDLVLRLNKMGLKGENIPYPLYGWRIHSNSTAGRLTQKVDKGLKAIQEYRPDWSFEPGLVPFSYRAIPPLSTPDVYIFSKEPLSEKTFEEMSRFAMQKEIGFVTTKAEPFFFPVQRVVQKIEPGCLMIRKELLLPEEVEALSSFRCNPQTIADRLSTLSYLHLYTPYM